MSETAQEALNYVLKANADLMQVFDLIEAGGLSADAASVLVSAHENLMEVHAAFRSEGVTAATRLVAS